MKKVISDSTITDALEAAFPNVNESYDGKTVLISAPYMMPNIEAFKSFFERRKINVIVADVNERLEEEDLLKYSGKYDVALIGDDRYTAKVFDNQVNKDKLRILSKWGTGIDSIDATSAAKNGVLIKNTPDAFSEPVAESLLGAVLAFNRTLLQSTRQMQSCKTSWTKIPAKTLPESTFGIIGLGNVGKAFLRKLTVLGVRQPNSIYTYDILGDIPLEKYGFSVESLSGVKQLNSLQNLLDKGPDFLIIACCQTTTNKGMIGARELDILSTANNRSVVLNMARGQLVVESDLVRYLSEGKLGGAALDVFWDEPLPADSPLRNMSNVLLSSHNANSSPYYWLKVHINTIRNGFPLLAA